MTPRRGLAIVVGLLPSVGLAVACMVLASFGARDVVGVSGSGLDFVTTYEARFHPLRSVLAGVPVVGYVHPVEPWEPAPPEALLFLAQYALAPVRVQESVDLPLVIGNFHSTVVRRAFESEAPQLRVVRDDGQGVVLYDLVARE